MFQSPFLIRYETSKLLGFDLDRWGFDLWRSSEVQENNHSKSYIWLHIWLLWTPSHLVPLPFSSHLVRDSVRDLCVLLDSELTMDAHIKQLCRSCFYQLRRLRVIRYCLSRGSLLTLACAFICNRMDYSNGVLCGVTAGRLDRLQSVLNATARLVLNIPKFSHISLAIRDELHWLPVQCRSQYIICILVRNSIVGSSPLYPQELCLPVASVLGRQHLRSAGRNDLLVPQFRTVNYGLRGFAISGFYSYGHHLSISYRFGDIRLQSF